MPQGISLENIVSLKKRATGFFLARAGRLSRVRPMTSRVTMTHPLSSFPLPRRGASCAWVYLLDVRFRACNASRHATSLAAWRTSTGLLNSSQGWLPTCGKEASPFTTVSVLTSRQAGRRAGMRPLKQQQQRTEGSNTEIGPFSGAGARTARPLSGLYHSKNTQQELQTLLWRRAIDPSSKHTTQVDALSACRCIRSLFVAAAEGGTFT